MPSLRKAETPAIRQDFLKNLAGSELQVLVDRLILEFDRTKCSGTAIEHSTCSKPIGHEIKKTGGWKLQNQVPQEVRLETSGTDARVR